MGQGKGPMEDVDDDVNGWITLSFALAGIAFDLACMIEFYKSGKRSEAARSVNMFSALLHVGADFLRSSSTLVMSFLILGTNFDSGCLDAYTSVLIGATILGGAAVGFFKWVKMLYTCLCKDDEVAKECDKGAGHGPHEPVSGAVSCQRLTFPFVISVEVSRPCAFSFPSFRWSCRFLDEADRRTGAGKATASLY